MSRAVLIVDDHPLILDAVCMTLQAAMGGECRIDTASDFAQARRFLDSEADWEFVLLDLALPDIDGFEALIHFQQARPELPVVILSGTHDRDTVLRCIELGAHGFIPKTHGNDRIHKALQLVGEGHVYLPAEFRGVTSGRRHDDYAGNLPQAAQTHDGIGLPTPNANLVTADTDTTAPGSHHPSDLVAARKLGLTGRQTDVLWLILRGLPNKLICRHLDLAEGTVKVHVSAVLRALGVHNRTQAVIAASRLGLQPRE